MEITLTSYEMFSAAMIGSKRQISCITKGLPNAHGYEGDGWNINIEGAAGEVAVAKCIGAYWNGSIDTFKVGGDVSGIEVRTRSKRDYDLLVRPGDNNDALFVLVIGVCPNFDVIGWMIGRDAKQPRYLQDYGKRPPAYFVPQSDLNSIESLPGFSGPHG